jgi:hypothetical protein
MIRILTITFATLAATSLAPRPAPAAEPPWCLFVKNGEQHCEYNSLQACLRDRVGGSNFCNPNPYARPETQRRKQRPRHDRQR